MVVAMNTHLDDQGSKSRLEAAKIILEEIRQYTRNVSDKGNTPVFLAGDFNSEPDQEAYTEMTSPTSSMVDLQMMVAEAHRYGDSNTFSGFDPETTRRKRIDFIFVNNQDPSPEAVNWTQDESSRNLWLIDGYAVLPNRFENGVYISDHQAVVGDMALR